jgi:hypothetical protein
VTAPAERYARAAVVLRGLRGRSDRLPCDEGDPAALAEALAVATQACEQVEEAVREREAAELECEEAMLQVASLWALLDRAAEVVDAHIGEHDGGTWETLTLAFELHQAVESEPDEHGARLLGELHAAQVALRAAETLVAAVQRGDGRSVRQCLAGFQQASCAWRKAAGTRQRADAAAAGVVAEGAPR